MINIKICGLFREADIDFANEAGPDFAGFVFAESRRQVSPAQAARLRSRLRDGIIPVGVFVNAPAEEIAACYRGGLIGIAQLHGDEDAAYIRRLKTLSAAGGQAPVPVIKALRIGGAETPAGDDYALYAAADYLLLDSGAGSGKPFDWDLLLTQQVKEFCGGGDGGLRAAIEFGATKHDLGDRSGAKGAPGKAREPVSVFSGIGNTAPPSMNVKVPDGGVAEDLPLGKAGAQGGPELTLPAVKKSTESGPPSFFSIRWFLAGGIDCDNIEKALSLRPFGIDVSSGAETDGVKDRKKMIELVKRVKQFQTS
jgi:phosphoribosylanthranilate isomerase